MDSLPNVRKAKQGQAAPNVLARCLLRHLRVARYGWQCPWRHRWQRWGHFGRQHQVIGGGSLHLGQRSAPGADIRVTSCQRHFFHFWNPLSDCCSLEAGDVYGPRTLAWAHYGSLQPTNSARRPKHFAQVALFPPWPFQSQIRLKLFVATYMGVGQYSGVERSAVTRTSGTSQLRKAGCSGPLGRHVWSPQAHVSERQNLRLLWAGASLYRSAMFQTLVCLCQGRVEGGKRKNGGREQRKRNWEEEKAGGERTKGRRMGRKG